MIEDFQQSIRAYPEFPIVASDKSRYGKFSTIHLSPQWYETV
jgi:hypothetical protein